VAIGGYRGCDHDLRLGLESGLGLGLGLGLELELELGLGLGLGLRLRLGLGLGFGLGTRLGSGLGPGLVCLPHCEEEQRIQDSRFKIQDSRFKIQECVCLAVGRSRGCGIPGRRKSNGTVIILKP